MLYHFYDLNHAMLAPLRFASEAMRVGLQNPFNPLAHMQIGRTMAANLELFERVTRKFSKPDFGIESIEIDDRQIDVTEIPVFEKPFCTVTHFKRKIRRNDPKVLVVAPMSGHFSTLLRGTVKALLPHHEVYITEWIDARQVPITEGRFNLDDYIAYIIEFIQQLGPDVNVMAVCQPAVPVLAAVAHMAATNDPKQPLTMTLMGGPIDTRISKTEVTELAENRPLSWFENSVINHVPAYYPGALRRVYPGFLQLTGFMQMNLDRHVGSHWEFYKHLMQGDGSSADKHRTFYNEYMAVMDLTAEFYLQTVETVFQKHSLPKGEMIYTDPTTNKAYPVDLSKIKKTAILSVEGELDDISALGQTLAVHDLCSGLPASKHYHHYQRDVGHYGIFNGRRWRKHIMPRVRSFIRKFDAGHTEIRDDTNQPMPVLWEAKKHDISYFKRLSKLRAA